MTDQDLSQDLHRAEQRLQAAMLAGDVDELDQLLDDQLIATLSPSTTRVTKAEDLQAHRSRELVLTQLVEDDLALVVAGDTGVTWVLTSLEGTNGGQPFKVRMHYLRTWHHDATHGWRVLAAQITPIGPLQ
ncbi:MAG TPA: nuclear transport factor 2 family protein [Kineosporiaceae bacterium]|nr:nuclear transport factor 2 family protein [Kineosporiaceae bacterium]